MTDKQKWKLLCKCTAKRYTKGYNCSLIEVKNGMATATDTNMLVKMPYDLPDGHYDSKMSAVESKTPMPNINATMDSWENIAYGLYYQRDPFMEEMKELCKNKKQDVFISFLNGKAVFNAKKVYLMCQVVPYATITLWEESWVNREVRYAISFETRCAPQDPYAFAVLMSLTNPIGLVRVNSCLVEWQTVAPKYRGEFKENN